MEFMVLGLGFRIGSLKGGVERTFRNRVKGALHAFYGG